MAVQSQSGRDLQSHMTQFSGEVKNQYHFYLQGNWREDGNKESLGYN